jgi:hypothetical protein
VPSWEIVARGQHQIDLRLLPQHQLDDLLQAVAGVHAQQRAVRFSEQMAVGQLHQQRRVGGGQRGYARQGVLLGESRDRTSRAIMLGDH